MARAFVFPGQGAQTVGMGKELADTYPAARAVFEEVDAVLGEKLSAMVWHGDIQSLTLTRNAQPALMATSIAALRALEAEGVALDCVGYVAGHSLGEYSALAATGALSLADTARLLRIRGNAMQDAVPPGTGAMAAIVGLELTEVRKVAAEAAQGGVVEAANDNDPRQVILSGHADAVKRAGQIARGRGARRVLNLPVSAPFHCALMQPAVEVMSEALDKVVLRKPSIPLIANVRAEPVTDPELIRKLLIEQITGTVRWRESIKRMASLGVTEIWEIGAGTALSGMIRRTCREIAVRNVDSSSEAKAVAETLAS